MRRRVALRAAIRRVSRGPSDPGAGCRRESRCSPPARRRAPANRPAAALRESRVTRVSALETVAESPHGLDQIAGFAELRAQALYVHVDRARLNVGGGFPHRL